MQRGTFLGVEQSQRQAREIDEIVPLAETLVYNFWQLLADEGVEVKNYQALEDTPLATLFWRGR